MEAVKGAALEVKDAWAKKVAMSELVARMATAARVAAGPIHGGMDLLAAR